LSKVTPNDFRVAEGGALEALNCPPAQM